MNTIKPCRVSRDYYSRVLCAMQRAHLISPLVPSIWDALRQTVPARWLYQQEHGRLSPQADSRIAIMCNVKSLKPICYIFHYGSAYRFNVFESLALWVPVRRHIQNIQLHQRRVMRIHARRAHNRKHNDTGLQ